MKVTRIINVIVQVLGLLGAIATIILCYSEDKANGLNDRRLNDDILIIVFITEAMFGIYQIIHAFVTSILKLVNKTFGWLHGIYWILVVICFMVWIGFLFSSKFNSFGDEEVVIVASAGWIPILYYLVISIIDLKKAFTT